MGALARDNLTFFAVPYDLLSSIGAVAMAAVRERWVQSDAAGQDGAVHVAWDPGTAKVTANRWCMDAGDEAAEVRLIRCGLPTSVTLPPGGKADLMAAATVMSDANGKYGCCRRHTSVAT